MCDVALITNQPVPSFLENILQENDIKIFQCPFKNFKFPQGSKWEFAFYKINALEYALSLGYDQYLLIDNDVLFIRDSSEIFEELKYNSPMAYEIPYNINQAMRNIISSDFAKFNNSNKTNIYQYGGEFIAGSNDIIKELITKCHFYYDKVAQMGFPNKEIGDEYLISMALACFKKVTNAYIYMDRCSTRGLYIASTRYNDKNCVMLHLPSEKAFGLYRLANYYLKKQELASLEKIVKICNLPKAKGKAIDLSFIFSLFHSIRKNKI